MSDKQAKSMGKSFDYNALSDKEILKLFETQQSHNTLIDDFLSGEVGEERFIHIIKTLLPTGRQYHITPEKMRSLMDKVESEELFVAYLIEYEFARKEKKVENCTLNFSDSTFAMIAECAQIIEAQIPSLLIDLVKERGDDDRVDTILLNCSDDFIRGVVLPEVTDSNLARYIDKGIVEIEWLSQGRLQDITEISSKVYEHVYKEKPVMLAGKSSHEIEIDFDPLM